MIEGVTPYANSIFEQPWWLDIVAPGQWYEVFVKDKKDNVIARMPYVSDGKKIFMPKMTHNLGIWMDNSLKGNYGRQKEVIYELMSQIPKHKSIIQSLSPNNEYILPFRWLGYSYTPSFSYRITDLSDVDSIYSRLNKTAKKNIKYDRNKVRICDELNFENLWYLQQKAYKAQNRRNLLDRNLLERIVNICEMNKCGKYFEVQDRVGHLHSCAYFVYDNEVCYYLMGASDAEFRSSGSQSLILWEGIQFAASHSRIFDFEGSNIEEIENFFRQFGGMCTPFYTIKKTTFINEIWSVAKPRIKRLAGYKI